MEKWKKLPSDIIVYIILPFIEILFIEKETIALKDVAGRCYDHKIRHLFSSIKLKHIKKVNLTLLNVPYLECRGCNNLYTKKSLKNMRTLKLKKCDFGEKMLEHMPELTHLEIDQCSAIHTLNNDRLKKFVMKNTKKMNWNILKNMKHLEELMLINCDIVNINSDFKLKHVQKVTCCMINPEIRISMFHQFPNCTNVKLYNLTLCIDTTQFDALVHDLLEKECLFNVQFKCNEYVYNTVFGKNAYQANA